MHVMDKLSTDMGDPRELGLAALRRRELDEAIRWLEIAREQSPADYALLQALGGAYHLERRDSDAMRVLLEAVHLQPRNAHARYNLAISLERMDRREEAIRELQSALRLEPTYALAATVLAQWQQQTAGKPRSPLERPGNARTARLQPVPSERSAPLDEAVVRVRQELSEERSPAPEPPKTLSTTAKLPQQKPPGKRKATRRQQPPARQAEPEPAVAMVHGDPGRMAEAGATAGRADDRGTADRPDASDRPDAVRERVTVSLEESRAEAAPAAAAQQAPPQPERRPPAAPRPGRRRRSAVASSMPCEQADRALLLSVLSVVLVLVGFILGPFAIFHGVEARRWIGASPYLTGGGRALAAIFIGALGTVLSIASGVYLLNGGFLRH